MLARDREELDSLNDNIAKAVKRGRDAKNRLRIALGEDEARAAPEGPYEMKQRAAAAKQAAEKAERNRAYTSSKQGLDNSARTWLQN